MAFNVQEAIREDANTADIYRLLRDNFFDQDWTKTPCLKGCAFAWLSLSFLLVCYNLWMGLA